MPLTAEQTKKISEAVGRKVTKPCPLCGETAWGWLPDLVVLQGQRYETEQPTGFKGLSTLFNLPTPTSAHDPADQVASSTIASLAAIIASREPPPAAYPTLPIMCNNCGNTMLLNVYTLGIADIWPAIAAGKMG